MSFKPLAIYEKIDPEFLERIKESSNYSLKEGKIPRKYKLLIAMALDASHGAVNGVKALAKAAMEAGATREEVLEAIKVVTYISGVGPAYTSAVAISDLF